MMEGLQSRKRSVNRSMTLSFGRWPATLRSLATLVELHKHEVEPPGILEPVRSLRREPHCKAVTCNTRGSAYDVPRTPMAVPDVRRSHCRGRGVAKVRIITVLLLGALVVGFDPSPRAEQPVTRGSRPPPKQEPIEPHEQQRFALVIGNGAYEGMQRLPNPPHDAEDLCAALEKLGFAVSCVFDVKTRDDIDRTIQSFRTRLPKGAATFFYFGGHGVQINGRNYLIPTTAVANTQEGVESNAYSLSRALSILGEAGAAPNIVVIDACRDDPTKGSVGLAKPGLAATADYPPNTILVYATSPNQVAIDGIGRNSLFVKHLLLKIPVMSNRNVGELFDAVGKEVRNEAREHYGTEQVPGITGSSYFDRFCLASVCETLEQQVARFSQELEDARVPRAGKAAQAKWEQQFDLLTRKQGELSLALAFGLLFDLRSEEDLRRLVRIDDVVKRLRWNSALAIGLSTEGKFVTGTAWNWSAPTVARNTAMQYCQSKKPRKGCSIVVVDGNLQASELMDRLKEAETYDYAVVRENFIGALKDMERQKPWVDQY
jgi:Caspase domain